MTSSTPKLTAGFCFARSSSLKKRTPPIRSLKKRTSMLYCVQIRLSSVGKILHDVVGGGGERVFRRLDLIAGSAGRARVDFELLDRLRDLIHELVRPRRAPAMRASARA